MKALFANWKQKAIDSWKKAYSRFLKIRGNPREIALGFALGLFVGMTPFMGAHTIIAVFFAAIFGCNKISAAIAVWISNPFTAPIVYPVTYFVGSLITRHGNGGGPIPDFSGSKILFMLQKSPGILWTLILGGIIIGIPLSVIGYKLSFTAVKKYQDDIKVKLAQRKIKKASTQSTRKRKKKTRKGTNNYL